MIVVLDSNIWISHLGLNSPVGTAVRFFIKSRKAQIALPEVIRLETENNLRDHLNSRIAKIKENYSALLTAFGELKEIVLPDESAVDNKVAGVFASTGLEIRDVPFSTDSARDSFIRTVRGLPPCDRSQEFKDGMIWADCLRLLKEDDVIFVTADKAFFQDRVYENGLNKVLDEEARGAAHSLRLLPSIEKLLDDIKVEVTVDERLLVSSYLEQNGEAVRGILDKNGFELQSGPKVERKLFATENPSKLFLSFVIKFECKDVTKEGRTDGILSVRGDGFYNSDLRSFEQLKSFEEELKFKLEDGTEKQFKNVTLRVASITMGHKTETYTVQYKLDEH